MTIDPSGPVLQCLYCTDIADLETAHPVRRGMFAVVGATAKSVYYALVHESVSGTSPKVIVGQDSVDWVRLLLNGQPEPATLSGDVTGTTDATVLTPITNAQVASDAAIALTKIATGDYVPVWLSWEGKITIAGGDTTKTLCSVDLTDISKSNKDYLIIMEFETILDTTDTTALGYFYTKCCYEASYDDSGVPTLGTIGFATGSNDFAIDHTGSPAIPTITSVTAGISGASATLVLTKPSSADSTFAQTRFRFLTVKEAL